MKPERLRVIESLFSRYEVIVGHAMLELRYEIGRQMQAALESHVDHGSHRMSLRLSEKRESPLRGLPAASWMEFLEP